MALRAPKAGDQFYVEKGQEKRYDDEEKRGLPRRIVEWILRILQGQVEPPSSLEWKSIKEWFKDGIVLCKLMNCLLKAVNLPMVPFRKKAGSNFHALGNLDSFLGAAAAFGVSKMALFQPSDLVEGRKGHFLSILNTMDALGREANAKGINPGYEEAVAPKADWCKDD